jgi:hypothetical protein
VVADRDVTPPWNVIFTPSANILKYHLADRDITPPWNVIFTPSTNILKYHLADRDGWSDISICQVIF